MRLVAATEAWVLHVVLRLVLLMEWLLLLWYGAREMCERIGEVMAGKSAPVRRHLGECVAIAATRACVTLGVSEGDWSRVPNRLRI